MGEIRNLIDTIFDPIIGWLTIIIENINKLSVPVARPLNIDLYFGPFVHLGPYWLTLITTICFLAFVYVICYIIVAYQGFFIKFKDTIKWW